MRQQEAKDTEKYEIDLNTFRIELDGSGGDWFIRQIVECGIEV